MTLYYNLTDRVTLLTYNFIPSFSLLIHFFAFVNLVQPKCTRLY